MALGKYNRRTVMADTGAVISGATVTFYNQLTGLPVTAYDDPEGLNPLGSSIESGDNGEVEVFLPPGKYRITTELGSYSDEITYEPVVGDMAVLELTDVTNGLFLLDAPAETSFIRVFASGYSDLRTVVQFKTDLGLENVSNTSDANKPISTATQTALDLKSDKSITISAGTGLTGGGDLSTNRTLNVDFGTAAGTVAEGDDARLSDAREWTAATVDQTEAETGTATERRAWTAERVRQAIVAVGTTVGKALLNLTNPSAVRFIRINADNTVTARSDSEMRLDLAVPLLVNFACGYEGPPGFNPEQTIFIADRAYTVISVRYIHGAASATVGVTGSITRESGTEARGTGDTVATVTCDSATNTVQSPSLSNTTLAAGDRLSFSLSAVITDLAKVNITIVLIET